jgi:MoaA/NifB/PqqE/SkfB family radical SAM enzyme
VIRRIDREIIAGTARRLVRNNRVRRETGLYPLANLFLFITMRCNAKCDHCFCWQDLNVGIPEMSVEQLDRVAETVPPFNILILTGGEPTLRRDLLEVMGCFAKRRKVDVLRINTNALFPDKLVKLTEDFKAEFPDVGIDFQISLDGLRETHDGIRGVPGNFDKVIESLQRLWPLQARYPATAVNVLTIINALNYRQLYELNDLLRREVSPDIYQGFEIVRDVNRTAWNILPAIREENVAPKNMDLPPVEDFPGIIADLERINAGSPWRADAYRLHTIATLRMIATGKPQYPCVTAGSAVGVVYSNGDVAHCEFTKPFANLEAFGFDFDALWQSEAAWERRRQIRCCHCTHGSFHGKAVEYSWRGIAGMVKQSL